MWIKIKEVRESTYFDYQEAPDEEKPEEKKPVVRHKNLSFLTTPEGVALVSRPLYTLTRPMITCEMLEKRYCLWIVKPNNSVVPLEYQALNGFEPEHQSTYVDHDPNPVAVQNFAEYRAYEIEPMAFSLLVGDWCMVDNLYVPGKPSNGLVPHL